MLKIGHRGACGYEPENTMRSFKKAIELGVDMIELDVQVCKTGEVVVIHDETVDRTTNGKGKVGELSFDELRSLDAGKGEKIPLLTEVFNLGVPINIELKGEGTAGPVALIIKEYDGKGSSYDDFFVSSFDYERIMEFKQLCPKVKVGFVTKELVDVGGLDVYSVNVMVKNLTKEFVDEAHSKGLKVFAYVVNDKEDIERIKSIGVDGIFTDYPDRLM